MRGLQVFLNKYVREERGGVYRGGVVVGGVSIRVFHSSVTFTPLY